MSNAIKIQSETVKRIREEFSKPKRCHGNNYSDLDSYCVLGAVFKYARLYMPDLLSCVVPTKRRDKESMAKFLDRSVQRFPGIVSAGDLLCRLNCSLDNNKACRYANEIVRLNDTSKFGQAWGKLSEALTYCSTAEEST